MPLIARDGSLRLISASARGLAAARGDVDIVLLERPQRASQMSSGSFWRSPSIVTTTSERACSIPGRHRRVLAEIALEQDDAEARVAGHGRPAAARASRRSSRRRPGRPPTGGPTRSGLLPSRSIQLVDVAGLVEDRHDDAHVGPRSAPADRGRRQHGLLFRGRRHASRVPIFGIAPLDQAPPQEAREAIKVETVWRRQLTPLASGGGSFWRAACWRPRTWPRASPCCGSFPWYVDETTFASSRATSTAISISSSPPRSTRRACCRPGWARA